MTTSRLCDLDAAALRPDTALAGLSRRALAHLGREYLLLGHLVDRVGIPLAIRAIGPDAEREIAIEEWMGASPIYSKRMQRALGFEGQDVETVFKNLQLDIGAPPQFMDFQFRLDGPESGEFWLPHCGALLDVEPFGEERVRMMCHDIEDPTFDATAAATHPQMRMRPIHRPPRRPADREPHCRWRVFVDPDAEPNELPAELAIHRASKLAEIDIDVPASDLEPGGWPDYAGPFDPGFQLEDLSHRALVIVCQEAAVQTHLLARAYLHAIARRAGVDTARELAVRHWTGCAALAAERLHRATGGRGDLGAIVRVFQLHPHFQPRTYVDFRVERIGADEARISLGDCPALQEGDELSWLRTLGADSHPALDAIAGAVHAHARCTPLAETGRARFAWRVRIDEGAAPHDPPPELKLAHLSRGARFEFAERRPLRR